VILNFQRRFWNSSTDPAEADVTASNGGGNGWREEKEGRTSTADLRTHKTCISGLTRGKTWSRLSVRKDVMRELRMPKTETAEVY